MPGYALRFRVLPLATLLCVGSCLSTEGYYRYQDAGPSGTAGTTGVAGSAGTSGGAGTSGSAGTTGTAGSVAAGTAGRGGTTGSAGSTTGSAGRGGTTGTAGRGGTTGTAGVTGSAGAGSVLFSDDFEGANKWNLAAGGMPTIITDGSKVLNLSETAGDQKLAAAGMATWTNYSIEARVKVLSFSGTSSSDVVAICVRLTDADHFYYFAIQATDMKGKIKIQNSGNSSLSSSFDAGFVANTWMKLRLDVVGGTLTAYVNDVMKATYTATGGDLLPMGGVGLMVQRTNAEFDDVVVRSLP